MDITFEKVEKLMEVAGVSYEEAKDALVRADGDLLDAIIILEQEGKINKGTGSYSTNEDGPASANNAGGNFNYSNNYSDSNANANNNAGAGANTYSNTNTNSNAYNYTNPNYKKTKQNYKYKDETTDFGDFMKSVGVWVAKLIKASLNNSFDVYRYGERILHLPVLGLVVFLIAGFWVLIPLLIVGLFFNCRYSFSGPDLGKDNIKKSMDKAMNVASDAAETVKESIKQQQQQQQQQQQNTENSESSETNGREDSNN